jgi:myosin heavy subunit
MGSKKVGDDDMCNLVRLDQDTLLENLRTRYAANIIYVCSVLVGLKSNSPLQTFTGGILVSVNPYQELPIYSPATMESYVGKLLGELPPHLYAIADAAYQNMREFKKNQSILIRYAKWSVVNSGL